MRYENLSKGQAEAIEKAVANYNKRRSVRRKRGLDVHENKAECSFVKDDRENYSVDLNLDYESTYVNFEGFEKHKSEITSGRYRLVGCLTRRLSYAEDAGTKQGTDTGSGHISNRKGNSLISTVHSDFAVTSGDAEILSKFSDTVNFGKCDGCGTYRRRDRMYIVEKQNDDGQCQYLQLGSSCANAVCVDKDLVDLFNKIDHIVTNEEIPSKDKSAKPKIAYEPRDFMKCVLVVNKLDLTSLMNYSSFKKKQDSDTNAVDARLQAISSYHTYERNMPGSGRSNTVKCDGVQMISDVIKIKNSPLCEWSDAVYRALYTDETPSDMMQYLVDKTSLKSLCESDEIRTQVEAVFLSDPDKFREVLDPETSAIDTHNQKKLSEEKGAVYSRSAGESIIQLLNDYMTANGGESLYSPKIKYNSDSKVKSSCPYYEMNGRAIKIVDLEKHQIDVNRSNLNNLLSNGYVDIPAQVNGDVPVPAYRLHALNAGKSKKDIKSARCTFSFGNGRTTGYYRESDTGLYIFMNSGKPMFSLSDDRIHDILGSNPSVESLKQCCEIASVKKIDPGNLNIMRDLQNRWQKSEKLMPVLYNKMYYFDTGASVKLNNIGLSDYILMSCINTKGVKSARLLAVSDIDKCMSNSSEYVGACIGRTAAMYDGKKLAETIGLYGCKRSIVYQIKQNGFATQAVRDTFADRLRKYNNTKYVCEHFENDYGDKCNIDSVKREFYVDIPGVKFVGKSDVYAQIKVNKSVSADGYLRIFDLSGKKIQFDADSERLRLPPDIKMKVDYQNENGYTYKYMTPNDIADSVEF